MAKDSIPKKLMKRIEELECALEESVKLQSHYAELLNMWDQGRRLRFKDAAEWMKRLQMLKEYVDGKKGKCVDKPDCRGQLRGVR